MSNSASEGDSQDELRAFNSIAAALGTLDVDARNRVIKTVLTFFDITPAATTGRTHLASAQPLAQSGLAPFSEDRSMSPKEFMLSKKPVTDVERIACLAYYLAHYRDTRYFKTVDLSKLNTEAAQMKFSNAANAVDNATKAGFLVQATKGQKQLSAVGELYVEALPDRATAKLKLLEGRPRRGRTRQNSTARRKEPSEVAE